MVDTVYQEIPQADPIAVVVTVCEDAVTVLLLIRDQLVALAAAHFHLLFEAGFIH